VTPKFPSPAQSLKRYFSRRWTPKTWSKKKEDEKEEEEEAKEEEEEEVK
jgi:hypothetical protein